MNMGIVSVCRNMLLYLHDRSGNPRFNSHFLVPPFQCGLSPPRFKQPWKKYDFPTIWPKSGHPFTIQMHQIQGLRQY
jgi:hypothetical protein